MNTHEAGTTGWIAAAMWAVSWISLAAYCSMDQHPGWLVVPAFPAMLVAAWWLLRGALWAIGGGRGRL